jgi:hypothetical protein
MIQTKEIGPKPAQINFALIALNRTLTSQHVLLQEASPLPLVHGISIYDFRDATLEAERDYRQNIKYIEFEAPNTEFTADLNEAINSPANVHIFDRHTNTGRLVTISLFPSSSGQEIDSLLTANKFDGGAQSSVDFKSFDELWMYTNDHLTPNYQRWSTFFVALTNPSSSLEVQHQLINPNGKRSSNTYRYTNTNTPPRY